MIRWTVDIGNIDLQNDLQGQQQKENVQRFIYDSSQLMKRRGSLPVVHRCSECDVIGQLKTYTQAQLRALIKQQVSSAFMPHTKQSEDAGDIHCSNIKVRQLDKNTDDSMVNDSLINNDDRNCSRFDRHDNNMLEDEENAIQLGSNNFTTFPSNVRLTSSYSNFDSAIRQNDLQSSSQVLTIFYTFHSSNNVRQSVQVKPQRLTFRGVDVVKAYLLQMKKKDNTFCTKFDLNPRLYKLFIADEITGEQEMAVQLDASAQHFTSYAVQPLPAARLQLFPQRVQLLSTTNDDVTLKVVVRPNDVNGKQVQRTCVVAPDLLAESLQEVLMRCLSSCDITPGSLRIKYGPLELNINQYYDFGPGCGHPNCPIAQHTVLALYRYGVTDIFVTGRDVNETSTVLSGVDDNADMQIQMDAQSAMTFQQFEVAVINSYGARQQRLLCVDGQHLYTVRPNSSVKMPKATQRFISDIEQVRRFADKPTYMEIVYSQTSGFATDHLVFTTAYNCALVDEKLRIIKRELRKRAAETTSVEQQVANHNLNEPHRKKIIERLQGVINLFYRQK